MLESLASLASPATALRPEQGAIDEGAAACRRRAAPMMFETDRDRRLAGGSSRSWRARYRAGIR